MTTTHETDVIPSCCSVPQTAHLEAEHSAVSSCCSVPDTQTQASEALDEVRSQQTPPEEAALRSAGFRLLLEHGQPVTPLQLAKEAGLSATQVTDILTTNPQGRVELDSDGNVLGVAGLTLSPTPHQLTIGSKTRWTWCALDAVGILAALEAPGSIQSTDPGTGRENKIVFTKGQPDNDAALFILGGSDGGNVREDWCPLVNFFTTRSEAEAWVAVNDLEGDIVSVVQIADEAAAMWRPVTDPTTPQVC